MHSRLELSPEHLRTVQDILCDTIPGREVRAFGSRVTGRAKPTSDVDLCIMGDTPLSEHERESLGTSFSESSLPMKVDVVEWTLASPAFRAIIDERYAVIVPEHSVPDQ